MRHAVHLARRQFKKTDRTIKVGRLMRLVGPQPFVIFCATFALRIGILPLGLFGGLLLLLGAGAGS